MAPRLYDAYIFQENLALSTKTGNMLIKRHFLYRSKMKVDH